MGKSAVIVDGVRTPFVRAGTALRDAPAWELGRLITRELLARTGIDPGVVDEVIFGCVAQPSDSANIARIIALRAGIPRGIPAFTVGRNCASGMEAITQAADKITSGRASVIVAGGVESMSRIALSFPLSFSWKMQSLQKARELPSRLAALAAFRLRDLKPRIALLEGLTDLTTGEIMGLTAERLAREYGVSREEQDAFALESHRRAVASRSLLAEEIHPFAVPPRFDEVVETDNGPRENSTPERLARLRPIFDRRLGTVTAGNSSQVTDGAAVLLIMEEEKARELGMEPLGRIAGHAYRGCDPLEMGLGPVHATPPALEEAGIEFGQLRRIELNEAFAAQVLACLRAFASERYAKRAGVPRALGEIDPEILNVRGGAVALGHPVGATGARLILTLLHELRACGGGYGLATLCIGGGQGGAVVVEGRAA